MVQVQGMASRIPAADPELADLKKRILRMCLIGFEQEAALLYRRLTDLAPAESPGLRSGKTD